MFEDSATHRTREASRDAKSLHAYQVLFALHCVGFLAYLGFVGDKPLHAFALGFALGGDGPFAPWQLVTYAFLHQNPIEIAVSTAILLTVGARLELSLGTVRFTALYLGSIAAVGLGHEAIETLGGEPVRAGAEPVLLGGLGGGAALIAAYALAYPQHRTLGLLPAPAFFGASVLFLVVAIVKYFDAESTKRMVDLLQSSLSNDQWFEKQLVEGAHPVVALPHAYGVLAGATAFAVDSVASVAIARARVRREIRVLEEELEARARVEQLLEKISREGISALSRRERKFLQYASRFYPPRDRVAGP